jgi:hypothetical protein
MAWAIGATVIGLAGCEQNGADRSLSPPSGLVAMSSSSGVALQWNPVASATSYAVNRCAVPATATSALCDAATTPACTSIIGTATGTSLTDDTSAAGDVYCYSVKACSDSAGSQCGPLSAPVAASRRAVVSEAIAMAHGEKHIAYAGQTLTLQAYAAQAEGTPVFEWEQIGGAKVALVNANTDTLSFVAPTPANGKEELLSFKIKVSDSRGPGRSSKVAVTVYPDANNALLLRNLSEFRTVQAKSKVTLHVAGSGATDPSFQWTQVAPVSPKVTLLNANTDNPSFVVPDVDAVVFKFDVRYTDRATGRSVVGRSEVESVKSATAPSTAPLTTGVTAGASPQVLRVQTGAVMPVLTGARVTLHAGATGGDNVYSWSWRQTAGTVAALSNATSPTPTLTAPVVATAETLSYEVTVTAGGGQRASTLVHVPVAPVPVPPVPVVAGAAVRDVTKPMRTVSVGQSLALSTMLNAPVWEQIAGVVATTTGTTRAALTLVAPNIVGSNELILMRVTGTDTAGQTVREITPVNIVRAPSIAAPAQVPPLVPVLVPTINAPLALSSVGIDRADEGQRGVVLGVQATGGSGNYVYSWVYQGVAGDPAITLRDANQSHPSFDAPIVTGNATLRFLATVTDGAQTARLPVTIVINDLAAPLDGGSLQKLEVQSAHAVTLHAPAARGGVPPYTFSVVQTQGDAVSQINPTSSGSWEFTAPTLPPFPPTGSTRITRLDSKTLTFAFTVTDSIGNQTTVSQDVVVWQPSTPLIADLFVSGPHSGNQGSRLRMIASITGGSGVNLARIEWRSTPSATFFTTGDADQTPNLLLPTIAPGGAPITLSVTATVTDNSFPPQVVTTAPLLVTVIPPPAPTLPQGLNLAGAGQASPIDIRGAATTCMQCGDPDLGTTCNDLDLVLGNPSSCPVGKNFCMQTIRHDRQGKETGWINYCGTLSQCYWNWWDRTKNVSECTRYDNLDFSANENLQCTYCCNSPDCNLDAPMVNVLDFSTMSDRPR